VPDVPIRAIQGIFANSDLGRGVLTFAPAIFESESTVRRSNIIFNFIGGTRADEATE
jgi:hypothetical protein